MWLEKIELLNELNWASVSVKLVLALILGGLLGYEREQKHRPAGLRTYVLVCLGATLACITNVFLCEIYGANDPARIPAQVISGMGFLGAGTIIVTRKQRIKGLTTAAGLWCCAAIGIAIGSGFYFGAILTTILIVLALKLFLYIDRVVEKNNDRIEYYAECSTIDFVRNLVKYAKSHNYGITEIQVISEKDAAIHIITFVIRIVNSAERPRVAQEIEALDGCIFLDNY